MGNAARIWLRNAHMSVELKFNLKVLKLDLKFVSVPSAKKGEESLDNELVWLNEDFLIETSKL